MLLVLGRPGSGCSTLLKNLAGFSEGYIRVEGGVKYNGVDVDIIKHRFRADVAYNAEGLFHCLRFRYIPLTRYSGGKLPTSYS
jgi:ABC-type multidrug transport system ATPase subunit